MTLKPIEVAFSEALYQEAGEPTSWDLTLEGPIYHRLHPKIVFATLQYERSPDATAPEIVIPGWGYECFENMSEAEKKHPDVVLKFVGRPWTIAQFLKSEAQSALIDFSPLGIAYLTKHATGNSSGTKLWHHTLPLWLNYALSPELWGPVGKWTRFHQELQTLFSAKNLLKEGDTPGYYLLKESAALIEKAGFTGTRLDKSYVLVLPWTFSLTGQKKLVEFVRQEF